MVKPKATVLLLVVDAVGAQTLDFLLDRYPGQLKLPNLSRLGLGRIVAPRHRPRLGRDGKKTCAMRLQQASASADSVIGHREMVGIVDPSTYGLFPNGFRWDFIAALEKRIGRKTIFNKMAGGWRPSSSTQPRMRKRAIPSCTRANATLWSRSR